MESNVPVIETIVNTLLQVAERVVELSHEQVVIRSWDKEDDGMLPPAESFEGKKIGELKHDALMAGSERLVAECVRAGQNAYAEHTVNGRHYAIRVLNCHPEKDKLFLVIECLEKRVNAVMNRQISFRGELHGPHLLKLYERILNNIYADIVVLDSQYRFIYVNPAAVRDEETRKWLIGKTDEEYFSYRNKPMAMAERRKNLYDTARNERRMIEWVEKTETLTGDVKSILRRIYPVFDEKGALDIIIGYSMNITELINVQEDLKTSRDTFQSAFHDSGIGMALLSADGRWLDVNHVICDMLGYTREELMKMSFREITYEDEWEVERQLVKKMLRREIPNFTMERKYISRQGKTVSVLLTLTMVWGRDDLPTFFIAQAVDITMRKELENEVNRKNAELEATRLKLVNKVSQLEELNYIIAHNLRGPAGNINVIAETLLGKEIIEPDNGSNDGFTVKEGLGFIKESSASLLASLGSLMQIASVKLDQEVPMDDCDVAGVIEEVSTQLQSAILEKHATIHLALEVGKVSYPRPYLESILYNFISNALKYSKPDVAPVITIATRQAGEHVQLSIKDNGLGIDMSRYGDRVFKLNQVFHGGKDSKGFGLYLTKTQVESLGGTVAVESKMNEGSEFIVLI